LVSVLASAGAAASQSFPSEVQKTLDMPCPPPCTLCHTTQLGQAGTAVKPFLIELRNQAIVATPMALVQAGDDAALAAALKHAQTIKMDSDKDMVPDTEELAAGLDPNTAGGETRICGPAYGCGARLAKSPPGKTGTIALAVFGLLFAARRLRSRR
jgi:hypothetical protein